MAYDDVLDQFLVLFSSSYFYILYTILMILYFHVVNKIVL